MNRRRFILLATAFALTGMPAMASDPVKKIARQLKKQGYTEIHTNRTLLGRTRIVAKGNGARREIILNSRTGEILRDFWQADQRAGTAAPQGGLLDRDTDDDDDRDRDDDGRDDNDRGDDNDSDRGRDGDNDSDADNDGDKDGHGDSDGDGDSGGDSDGDGDD